MACSVMTGGALASGNAATGDGTREAAGAGSSATAATPSQAVHETTSHGVSRGRRNSRQREIGGLGMMARRVKTGGDAAAGWAHRFSQA